MLNSLKNPFTGQLYPTFTARTTHGGGSSRGGVGRAANYSVISSVGGARRRKSDGGEFWRYPSHADVNSDAGGAD